MPRDLIELTANDPLLEVVTHIKEPLIISVWVYGISCSSDRGEKIEKEIYRSAPKGSQAYFTGASHVSPPDSIWTGRIEKIFFPIQYYKLKQKKGEE